MDYVQLAIDHYGRFIRLLCALFYNTIKFFYKMTSFNIF